MPLLCCECLTFAIKANLRNVWGFCQVGLPIGIVLLLRVSQLLAEFQSRHYSQCFFLTANFIWNFNVPLPHIPLIFPVDISIQRINSPNGFDPANWFCANKLCKPLQRGTFIISSYRTRKATAKLSFAANLDNNINMVDHKDKFYVNSTENVFWTWPGILTSCHHQGRWRHQQLRLSSTKGNNNKLATIEPQWGLPWVTFDLQICP